MAYEMVMPYHLHMPSYFLETFTEYPYNKNIVRCEHDESCKFYLHLTMFPQILLLVRLFGQYGMSA